MASGYCLIGAKLGHSFSAEIHRKMGYDYELCEVPQGGLAHFVNSREYLGYNVTIPYKQAIIPMLDCLDDSAKLIGAVNTVVNRGGILTGYNTDISGMEYALKRAGIVIKDKKVLVLGSGGTSAMATVLMSKLGAGETVVISRGGENNYNNISSHNNAAVIINTTPVGMYPNNGTTPLDLDIFPRLEGVFDAIYNPLKTALIMDAEDRGIKCSGGLAMLAAQAKAARDLYVGNVADDALTEKIIKEISDEKRNIVLIGMPSCGKSSLGVMLSKRLNKPFVDTDCEVEKKAGCSIPEIFAVKGEAHFRAMEADVVADCGKKLCRIIATGGGAVMNEKNVAALRQNGVIIYLDRCVKKLITCGRPLSKDKDAIERLYRARVSTYNKSSDYKVDSNDSLENCLEQILEILK